MTQLSHEFNNLNKRILISWFNYIKLIFYKSKYNSITNELIWNFLSGVIALVNKKT